MNQSVLIVSDSDSEPETIVMKVNIKSTETVQEY